MPTVNPAILKWSGGGANVTLSDNFRKLDFVPDRVYTVTCSPDATELDVLTASGLPSPGELFPGTGAVYAKTARAICISPVLWNVQIGYVGFVSQTDKSESPTTIPATVDWDDVEVEEEIDEDFDGNPIVTEAGEPVHGIKAIFCDQVATIKKNMLTYDSFTAAVYRRSVNSDTFLGWPPGTAKLMKLSAKDVKSEYYEVTAVVQFRIPYRTTAEKAWYSRWRHEGLLHKLDLYGSTKIVRALDDLKTGFASSPVLLDEDGFRLPPGSTPFWKETKLYAALPLSALGLLS